MSACEIVSVFVKNSHATIAGDTAFDKRTDEPEARPSVTAGGFRKLYRVVKIFFRSIRFGLDIIEADCLFSSGDSDTDTRFSPTPSVCPFDSAKIPRAKHPLFIEPGHFNLLEAVRF